MDASFAELLGMHAGDGTIYRTSGLVWELRGGLEEEGFYDSYVSTLLQRCHLTSFWKGRRGRAYGVRACDRRFIERIIEAGFPIGSKSANLSIPRCVLEAETPIWCAFLRGFFASDGTAYLARINNEQTPHYPIIECSSISSTFIEGVRTLLAELGIDSYLWMSKQVSDRCPNPLYTLRIAGEKRTSAFVEVIGLPNPKMKRVTPDNL
jgi:hypothetical protein